MKKLAMQIMPSTTAGSSSHTGTSGTRSGNSASGTASAADSAGSKWIGVHPDRDWIIQPLVVNAFYESISNKISEYSTLTVEDDLFCTSLQLIYRLAKIIHC